MVESASVDGGAQFVTLGIDQETFAVEVEVVREILDFCPVGRVPNAPAFMIGMIDVRGRAVPVIDLRIKLGLEPISATENTRIIVLEESIGERSLALGLVADKVFEVTALDEQAIEPPPEVGVRWRSEYIRGIGRRRGAFVIILDLRRLLTSDEVALIGLEDA